MLKNVEKVSINYSPNFDLKKRPNYKVKYLIFHYTGMKSEAAAIKRLTSFNSKVSCHYFIKINGEILRIVPDSYIAWHAGTSSWKNDNFLNSSSIGIEISNPGHDYNYKNFNKKQIKSIISLSKKLKKKYRIKKKNILGHSDIAPLRKKDPGEKFPWKLLAKNNLCLWHNVNFNDCKKLRKKKLHNYKNFDYLLFRFGYTFTKNSSEKVKIYKNFQRRFRPELISSVIDKECYAILKSLI